MAVVTAWLRDLAGAWVFYSVLPAWPGLRPRFQRIARFAPWIGVAIAMVQVCLWLVLLPLGWPPSAVVLLLLTVGVWITGGLHIDGVMDTADGLAAGPARCLEAMEDSRVGASGVQALATVLMLQFAALWCLAAQDVAFVPIALVSAAFWGRCAPLWALLRFPYLKVDGTAAFHRSGAKGLREWFPALLLVLAALGVAVVCQRLLPWVVITTTGLIISAGTAEYFGRRLGGHTGDSYGAVVVWSEALILVLLAALLPPLASAAV